MTTPGDPTFEQRALHLFRDLLDMDADAREQAFAGIEPRLRVRAQALLACVVEGDLHDAIAEQRIGPYQLLERIGQGGMGEVFSARRVDGAFDKNVAIKRIWAGHAPLAARFVRERQLLARLQHPHIAQLLDGGIDDAGKPWLAMELVRGADIASWCDARNATLAQRVELLAQVCDAVDHAHRQLIVHRDIKPSNILVDDEGRAKLLDFGIARLLDDEDGERTQTQAMTPAWATPEQQQGKPITTASDIYQLGLLARALLSGLSRGESGQRMSVEYARLRRDAPERGDAIARHRGVAADALQRQLCGDLDSIVALATARDADERYPSAHALADDLRRWLRSLPVQARADERGYRLRRAARRYWPALAAGIAALAFLGYHVYSLQDALERTERERQRAQVAEQRALAARERAEQERGTANAVSDYFIKMFSMLGPEAIAGSKPATVQQLLDTGTKGLDDVQAARERSPQALVAMLNALSNVHVNLGEHARALELADKAVAIAREAEDKLAQAEALRRRSSALYWLGRTDDAFDVTLQAMNLLDNERGEYGILPAKLHGDLANGYHERGELAKAMHHARLGIDGLRRDEKTVRMLAFVQALNNGADIAIYSGDTAQARAWLDESTRRYPQLANPNPSSWVLLQTHLAHLDLRENHASAAQARLQALLPKVQAQFGAEHPRTAHVLDFLLKSQLASGAVDAAVETGRQLVPISTAVYGADHPAVGDARGLQLMALLLAGKQGEAVAMRAQLREPCMKDAVDAQTEMVKLACARSDGDAAAIAAIAERLSTRADAMPWQRRIAQRWRKELAIAP